MTAVVLRALSVSPRPPSHWIRKGRETERDTKEEWGRACSWSQSEGWHRRWPGDGQSGAEVKKKHSTSQEDLREGRRVVSFLRLSVFLSHIYFFISLKTQESPDHSFISVYITPKHSCIHVFYSCLYLYQAPAEVVWLYIIMIIHCNKDSYYVIE